MAVIRYNVCNVEQNEQKKKICSQAIIMGVIFQPISKKYLRNLLPAFSAKKLDTKLVNANRENRALKQRPN